MLHGLERKQPALLFRRVQVIWDAHLLSCGRFLSTSCIWGNLSSGISVHTYLSLENTWSNTLKPEQNGRHIPDSILKCMSSSVTKPQWVTVTILLYVITVCSSLTDTMTG